jgi:hypothetical protein
MVIIKKQLTFFLFYLDRKFQDVTSCQSVKTSSLEVDRKYPITRAEMNVTKFGPTVLLSTRDTSFHTLKVFMPKRYGSVFSDADIEDINTEKVLLHLVYKRICDKTILHILTIEKLMTLYYMYTYDQVMNVSSSNMAFSRD